MSATPYKIWGIEPEDEGICAKVVAEAEDIGGASTALRTLEREGYRELRVHRDPVKS